jgi:hypothetical protein
MQRRGGLLALRTEEFAGPEWQSHTAAAPQCPHRNAPKPQLKPLSLSQEQQQVSGSFFYP